MLTQMQKMLRAKPTAIIVEVAIPDACGGNVEVLKAEKILSWIYLMGNCIWRGCHWQHEGVATGHLAVLSSVFFLHIPYSSILCKELLSEPIKNYSQLQESSGRVGLLMWTGQPLKTKFVKKVSLPLFPTTTCSGCKRLEGLIRKVKPRQEPATKCLPLPRWR